MAVVMVTAFLLVISPVFFITDINISGNDLVTTYEIQAHLGIGNRQSLLFYNIGNAQRLILQNFYISEVSFTRSLPRTLNVYITERRPIAYVEHAGMFLLLDDYGMVLEITPEMARRVPLLNGLNITHFQLGREIEIPDNTAFNSVVLYALLLNHHGLIDNVTYMDVSDTNNIRILINYLEFNVGDVVDADEKVRTIIAMLESTPNVEILRGFVSMRRIDRQYFLEILQ